VAGLAAAERAPALVRALIADESVRPYIRVNVGEGVSWFNSESFGQVLWWMVALDVLDAAEAAAAEGPAPEVRAKPAAGAAARAKPAAGSMTADRLRAAERLTATLAKAAKTAGYQLDKLEDATRG
jgi:pimeloyl-ACP methyl ester carboxylesterase